MNGLLSEGCFIERVALLYTFNRLEPKPPCFGTMTWGLIYKTVREMVTKSVRTPKSQVLRAAKNIPIYKTLRTHTVRNLCFINHRLPTSVRS